MALTDKLTAIGNAIREKTGGTALLTLDAMPLEIAAIETGGGGGGDLPEEAFVVTGDCGYRFANGGWDWFIELYGNKITTKDIVNPDHMFALTTIDKIPFEINLGNNTASHKLSYIFYQAQNLKDIPDIDCASSTHLDCGSIFRGCAALENLPYLYNLYPNSLSYFFNGCYWLREIPDDYMDTWDFSRINTYVSSSYGSMFCGCYSLRQIPQNVLSKFGKKTATGSSSFIGELFYSGFESCHVLDELINLPFSTNTTLTSNMFSNGFNSCSRLKELTFETDANGAAKPAKWKSQTIDLTKYVGYTNNERFITDYNSGITKDKNASNAKDTTDLVNNYLSDPDWYSTDLAHSRYDLRAARNTINSLPDTSAYLAANGGTNTIKFLGKSGSAIPQDYVVGNSGSAIEKLTAEEIAVATAKGWTVTFA